MHDRASALLKLQNRAGITLLVRLFAETSVFLPVQNNCYIQLCGHSVSDTWSHSTNTSAQSHGVVQPARRLARTQSAPTQLLNPHTSPSKVQPRATGSFASIPLSSSPVKRPFTDDRASGRPRKRVKISKPECALTCTDHQCSLTIEQAEGE